MSALGNKLTGWLGRPKQQEPVPYRVRCFCGETYEGDRDENHLIRTCTVCGSSVFIWPKRVLPPVEQPTPKREPKKSRQALPAQSSTPRPSVSPKEVAAAVGRGLAKFIPPRAWFTTPRLVAAGVFVFVLLTVVWQVRSAKLSHYREIALPEGRKGLAALAEGDLVEADIHLRQSVEALNALHDPYPDSAKIRQAFAEVDIFDRLIDGNLDDLLSATALDPSKQRRELKGKAVIFEASVEANEETGWKISSIILLDGKPIEIIAPSFPAFEKITFAPKNRWLLGARLDRLEKNPAGNWQLVLEKEGAVLFTANKLLEVEGLLRDASRVEIVNKQREIVSKLFPSES